MASRVGETKHIDNNEPCVSTHARREIVLALLATNGSTASELNPSVLRRIIVPDSDSELSEPEVSPGISKKTPRPNNKCGRSQTPSK